MDSSGHSALDASVLVLNRLFMAIHIISVRRAFCLLCKNLAEVVSLEDGQFTTYDFATWREVIATDLYAAFLCLQRAARRMVAAGNGGRIIAVTSVHEHQPRVGSAAYDAAKHGLGGLMKTLALELGQYRITANCVGEASSSRP